MRALPFILLLACSAHEHGADAPPTAIQLGQTHTPGLEFRQASLIYEGEAALQRRLLWVGGAWSEWAPVETTWSEGRLHVGRVILRRAAEAIELRGSAQVRGVFHPQVVARPQARALYETKQQGVAPADLVVSRHEWGARQPDLICNNVVAPYRMSIHHTAGPNDDGGDAAARVRQIQAFHMDGRGWCDIGYHFVVSQGGQIFQGRLDETRPGAHVGGENSGNVGISLIGNFEEQIVGEPQMAAASRIVAWVSATYDIPLDEAHLKGHRQWPGQATSCPGRDLLNRLGELRMRAGALNEIPPPQPDAAPPQPDAEVTEPEPSDFALSATSEWPDPLRLTPGAQASGAFVVRNTGSVAWEPALTWLAPAPEGRSSDFALEWLAADRVARVPGVVPPGGEARFEFKVQGTARVGEHVEAFGLHHDGRWLAPAELSLTIRVLEDPDEPVDPEDPMRPVDPMAPNDPGQPMEPRSPQPGTGAGFADAGTMGVSGDSDSEGCGCRVEDSSPGAAWLLLLLYGLRKRRA